MGIVQGGQIPVRRTNSARLTPANWEICCLKVLPTTGRDSDSVLSDKFWLNFHCSKFSDCYSCTDIQQALKFITLIPKIRRKLSLLKKTILNRGAPRVPPDAPRVAVHGIQRSGTNFLCEFIFKSGIGVLIQSETILDISILGGIRIKKLYLLSLSINMETRSSLIRLLS